MIGWMAAAALAGVGTTPPPEGLDEVHRARKVALVVGVDQYADPKLPALAFPSADAAGIAGALRAESGGAFDEVRVLSGSVDREAIWDAMADLTAPLERDDTFLLYFAGHGTLEWRGADGTELYLLGSDARLDEARDTGIAMNKLDTAISELRPLRRVVILDSCYSGLGRSRLSEATVDALGSMRSGRPPAPDLAPLTSRYDARLYAADVYEPASEDPDLGNGVYTHFLLAGLENLKADANGDGAVELLEAHWWAQDQTMRHTGRAQNPWVDVTQVGGEWLYLAKQPQTAPDRALLFVPSATGRLPTRGAPVEIEIDGEAFRSGGVQPGVHEIAVYRGGEEQARARLALSAGDRIDVRALADGLESLGPRQLREPLDPAAVERKAERTPFPGVEHALGPRAVVLSAGVGGATLLEPTGPIATAGVLGFVPTDGARRFAVSLNAFGSLRSERVEWGTSPVRDRADVRWGGSTIRAAWIDQGAVPTGPLMELGVLARRVRPVGDPDALPATQLGVPFGIGWHVHLPIRRTYVATLEGGARSWYVWPHSPLGLQPWATLSLGVAL